MNSDPLKGQTDRVRLLGYLDGTLSEDERRAVEGWLKEDVGARALLSEIAEQAVVMVDLERSKSAAPQTSSSAKTGSIVRAIPRIGLPLWFGIAAVLVACLALGAMISRLGSDAPIARLESVSEDAKFSTDHLLPQTAGSALGKGWVRLERGELRIVFRSGASVKVTGPAEFGIDSPMRSYLDYGHVRVHAPESARDFVVATESMEVVDLGTRFELAVNRETRESAVTVSEGLVDLHLGAPGTPRRIQPLEAGYSAEVDAAGDIVVWKQIAVESKTAPRLLAHWRFDDEVTEGGESIGGVHGRAIHLGESGFIDVSDLAKVLGQTEAFTISAWVRNPSEGIAILFSLSDGTERDRVQFHLNRRHLVFGWQNGALFDAVSGQVDEWEADRWYHVAMTAREGHVRLYRDGELIGSSSLGQRLGTKIPTLASVERPTHAWLGKTGGINPQFFRGEMDDVQIYAKTVLGKNIPYLFENPGKTWVPPGMTTD